MSNAQCVLGDTTTASRGHMSMDTRYLTVSRSHANTLERYEIYDMWREENSGNKFSEFTDGIQTQDLHSKICVF